MAVVGNAKNARLTFRSQGLGDMYYISVWARGRAYDLHGEMYEEDAEATLYVSKRKPIMSFLGSTWAYLGDDVTFVFEIIDNAIKVYQDGTQILSIVDSANNVAGDWEIESGTLISFENLDAPEPPAALPLYIGDTPVKKVYIGNTEVIHTYIGDTQIW